jgi:neutral ceramidase
MMKRLDTVQLSRTSSSPVKIGWSKFSITPGYPMPMAGYTPKPKFDSIHDSVYGRVLSIQNESQSSFIVSLDLMLFPPIIKSKVIEELSRQRKDYFVFFSATHTHSSLGGWNRSAVGRLVLGAYHSEWVDKTVQDILGGIESAKAKSIPSSVYYWEADATEFVENRLDGSNGKVDGQLRGLKFIRADSSMAILTSYSAHPTNVELLSRIISADYPGALTDHLEKNGFGFGVFIAGMMGSHRLRGFDGPDFEKIQTVADTLSDRVLKASLLPLGNSLPISTAHIPIEFGPSQLRIAKNWKVRDWAFSSAIGPLQGELTYLKVGPVILLGTPCDFSGEIFVQEKLDSLANVAGMKLIVSSFNGDYTGYITADQYYEKGHAEEVMALNWVGPYFGDYYSQMIQRIIQK